MNHEPETLEHLHRINAQPLLELEGQTVSIEKISNNNGKDTMVEVGFKTTGKLTLLASDSVLGVLVTNDIFDSFIRTSIVVNVESADGGALVHTMNSTYLVSKISEAQ